MKKFTLKQVIILLSIFLLAGCGLIDILDNKTSTNTKKILDLKISESGVFDGLTINFLDVPEDSRCPLNAYCIWEGNAKLLFSYTTVSDSGEFALNTNKQFENLVKIDGIKIELILLSPYPATGPITDPDKYSAKLKLTK